MISSQISAIKSGHAFERLNQMKKKPIRNEESSYSQRRNCGEKNSFNENWIAKLRQQCTAISLWIWTNVWDALWYFDYSKRIWVENGKLNDEANKSLKYVFYEILKRNSRTERIQTELHCSNLSFTFSESTKFFLLLFKFTFDRLLPISEGMVSNSSIWLLTYIWHRNPSSLFTTLIYM